MPDRGQIRAVYKDFEARSLIASRLSTHRRRQYLQQWLIEPALSQWVDGMEKLRRKGQYSKGAGKPHVFAVILNGDTAEVDDCTDETAIRTVDKSGKIISRGRRHEWNVTEFRRTSDGWRIYRQGYKDESCVGKS